ARKGGAIYFRGSAGTHKETFLAHLALAGHEIDAVETVYLNDKAVTLDANGNVLTAPYAQTRRESFTVNIPRGQTSVLLPRTPISGTIFITGYDGSGELGGVTHPAFTLVGRTVTLSAAQQYSC